MDGNQSRSNISSSDTCSLIDGSVTSDEIDNIPSPAVFQVSPSGSLEISDSIAPPDLPLIIGANFLTIRNKKHSLNKLLSELGPDLLLGMET